MLLSTGLDGFISQLKYRIGPEIEKKSFARCVDCCTISREVVSDSAKHYPLRFIYEKLRPKTVGLLSSKRSSVIGTNYNASAFILAPFRNMSGPFISKHTPSPHRQLNHSLAHITKLGLQYLQWR
jgi:hypothetical protein